MTGQKFKTISKHENYQRLPINEIEKRHDKYPIHFKQPRLAKKKVLFHYYNAPVYMPRIATDSAGQHITDKNTLRRTDGHEKKWLKTAALHI